MKKNNFELELEMALQNYLANNTTHFPKVILPIKDKWRGLTGYATHSCYIVNIEYGDVESIMVVADLIKSAEVL